VKSSRRPRLTRGCGAKEEEGRYTEVITVLGAFAKLRKATISFAMTVYPSVHTE
jgi:hypothetical protein